MDKVREEFSVTSSITASLGWTIDAVSVGTQSIRLTDAPHREDARILKGRRHGQSTMRGSSKKINELDKFLNVLIEIGNTD